MKYLFLLVVIIVVGAGCETNNPKQTIEKYHNQEQYLSQCLEKADLEYQMSWDSLCTVTGREKNCEEFLGSPKDQQLRIVREDTKKTCILLYK